MRNLATVLTLAVVVVFVVPPTAWGSSFDWPPELYAPEWQTHFPYQRNIDWTFDRDPRSSAPHYQGYHDDALQESDYVEFTGDVTWYEQAPGTGAAPYDGVIGIDNRGGNERKSGTAIFHIDNWDDPRKVKNLWEEIDFAYSTFEIFQDVVLPFGYEWSDAWESEWRVISQEPALERVNLWIQVIPNPPWEEKVYEFGAPPGEFVFIDRLHIATECVPEPAAMSLSLLVLSTLGGWALIRRRRR